MEHDHMIEALASNGSKHSLDIGSLPGRARCGQNFADAHVSQLFSKVIAKAGLILARSGSPSFVAVVQSADEG